MTTAVQIVVLLLGLAAGFVWTRSAPVVSRDTLLNFLNGALLYPVRLGLGLLGIDRIHLGLVDIGSLPVPLQFAITLVALDFVRYWLHFAAHRVPFLWAFHRVHHSPTRMDASVGLRMHVVDFLQLSLLPPLVFGVLFDTTGSPAWLPAGVLCVGIVFDGIEHANVRFPVERPWARAWYVVFNSPLFHSWHHVREGRLCDGNYANVFPIWDRLFGTAILRDAPPAAYGVEPDQEVENTVLGMQLLKPAAPVDQPAGSWP